MEFSLVFSVTLQIHIWLSCQSASIIPSPLPVLFFADMHTSIICDCNAYDELKCLLLFRSFGLENRDFGCKYLSR
jgi:hypothetical protein